MKARGLLDVIDDGSVIAREVKNTRSLSEREIEEGIEVIDYKDRFCSKERRGLRDAELVVPGAQEPVEPRANADAAVTMEERNVAPTPTEAWLAKRVQSVQMGLDRVLLRTRWKRSWMRWEP